MRRMDAFERQMDLLGLFLELRRPVTFIEIRQRIPDAYPQGKVESAKRQFERDKDELRDLGVPIEPVVNDEGEDAYLVRPDRYYLPELSFTAEETAALALAGDSFGEDDDAARAVHKLLTRADVAVFSRISDPLVAAGPDFSLARMEAIAEAIRQQRAVTFGYRTAQGDRSERHVDPWALVHRSGHAYLVGLDRDRGERRSFRLSRFDSDPVITEDPGSVPPPDFDAAGAVAAGPWGPDESERVPVRIAFSDRVAWWATAGLDAETVATSEGWVEMALPGSLDESFVSWVLSFGADAEVQEPAVIRQAVIERLEAARG